MAGPDFQKIVAAVCEHAQAMEVWQWGQLAFLAFRDGKQSGAIGRCLHSNSRYWKKAPGSYSLMFEWSKIIEDGLLPPPLDLEFLKMCRRLRASPLAEQALEYGQIAEISFGQDSIAERKKVASQIVRHRAYITLCDGVKIRFHWDRIGIAHRINTEKASNIGDCDGAVEDLMSALATALDHEYRDAKRAVFRCPQPVDNVGPLISQLMWGFCYRGKMADREDEDPVLLLEGMPVLVKWSADPLVNATLLVYDPISRDVVLQFSQSQFGQQCLVYPDISRLLKSYRPFVDRLLSNKLAMALIQGRGHLKAPYAGRLRVSNLRIAQEIIVRTALTNRVLYVWGPPGTGKTYTLAALIAELALRGERILAASISNRAVDELTEDLFERLKQTEKGRELLGAGAVLRLGFAGTDLLKHDELFPHRTESKAIRLEIQRIRKARSESNDVEQRAKLQQQLSHQESLLGKIVKDRLSSARIVFTTVAQVALVQEFRPLDPYMDGADKLTEPFDSVVCDEASMMNLTHVIPMCWWGRKRVVIAGDDRQLGPVVVSTSQPALAHLHTSLFDLERSRPLKKQRILQLTEQGRMHDSICSLINAPFYDGALQTISADNTTPIPPLMQGNRLRSGILHVRHSETRLTSRGSRFNSIEAQTVVRLLKVLLSYNQGGEPCFKRIGVVAAYRAQAGHIRQLLREHKLEREVRIQVGTVHAFQGGEADAVIWNLVDSPNLLLPDGTSDPNRPGKPGRLFHQQTGERLINVAISRAKAAVYVVGHIGVFLDHPPNCKMSSILRRIRDEGHSWELADLEAFELTALTNDTAKSSNVVGPCSPFSPTKTQLPHKEGETGEDTGRQHQNP